MTELQTILGTDIPINTRGILYLCKFDYERKEIAVTGEVICEKAFKALNLYANIPNPESQLVTGKTFDELITNLHQLHKDMKDPVWLEELYQTL
jgi:hypothetical protein